MISLCAEEAHHSMDLYRSGGNELIGKFIEDGLRSINYGCDKSSGGSSSGSSSGSGSGSSSGSGSGSGSGSNSNSTTNSTNSTSSCTSLSDISLAVRVLSAASSHTMYVTASVHFSTLKLPGDSMHSNGFTLLTSDGKIQFESLCELLNKADSGLAHATLSLLMRILRSLPLSHGEVVISDEKNSKNSEKKPEEDTMEEQGKATMKNICSTI